MNGPCLPHLQAAGAWIALLLMAVFCAAESTANAQFTELSDQQFESLVNSILNEELPRELFTFSSSAPGFEWDYKASSFFLPSASNNYDRRAIEHWIALMLKSERSRRFAECCQQNFEGAEQDLITAVSNDLVAIAKTDFDHTQSLALKVWAANSLANTDGKQLEKSLAIMLLALTNAVAERTSDERILLAYQNLQRLLRYSRCTRWVAEYCNLTYLLVNDGDWQGKLAELRDIHFDNLFRLPEGSRTDPRLVAVRVTRIDRSTYEYGINVSSYGFYEGMRSSELMCEFQHQMIIFFDNLDDLLFNRFAYERREYAELRPYASILKARTMQFDSRFVVTEAFRDFVALEERLEFEGPLERELFQALDLELRNLNVRPDPVLGVPVFNHFDAFSRIGEAAHRWETAIVNESRRNDVRSAK